MKKLIIAFSLFLICCISFGQSWVPVGTGFQGVVNALDSANGLLYIGGAIDSAGGIMVNNITAWNGSNYSALGTGLTGPAGSYVRVQAIIEYNGNIIAAGSFDSAGGVPVNNIAMWNGSSWSALGSGLTGTLYPGVSALSVYNNNLYVAGNFDSAGGVPVLHIAQWNGTSWSAVGKGISYTINTMAVYNNNLYVGGVANSPGAPKLSEWNGTVWDSIKGIYDSNNYSNICNGLGIQVLSASKGLLYITGGFSDSANKYGDFASWNGTNLNWNIGGYDNTSMCIYNGFIIAGTTSVYYYNDTTWQTVGSSFGYCMNPFCRCQAINPMPDIFALAGYSGRVYVGGTFNAAYGNQASGLAMFSGIVGINEVKKTKTITVYPNPSKGKFSFEEQGISDKEQVEVYNMLGEKVLSQYPILTTQYSIDLSSQPTGVYLYRITNTDGSLVSSGKLIKQ